MKPLTLSAIGCGHRTRTYVGLATRSPEKYEVVAGADPVADRLEMVRLASRNPKFQSFHDADAILKAPLLADIMIIGTQALSKPSSDQMTSSLDVSVESHRMAFAAEKARLEHARLPMNSL